MYTDDLIDQFQSWQIPEEHYDVVAQMVEQFGEEYMGQWWEAMTEPYTHEQICQWRKELQDNLFFCAKSWYEMVEILIEIFEFETIERMGLWDEDDLISRLSHKDLLSFYDLPDRRVLCTKGYKIKEPMIQQIDKGFHKWKQQQEFYDKLRRERNEPAPNTVCPLRD
jgi:hypothetical protein